MSRFFAFLFVVTLFVGCAPAEKPATAPADTDATTAPAGDAGTTDAAPMPETEKPAE
jgi:hypothetical protein